MLLRKSLNLTLFVLISGSFFQPGTHGCSYVTWKVFPNTQSDNGNWYDLVSENQCLSYCTSSSSCTSVQLDYGQKYSPDSTPGCWYSNISTYKQIDQSNYNTIGWDIVLFSLYNMTCDVISDCEGQDPVWKVVSGAASMTGTNVSVTGPLAFKTCMNSCINHTSCRGIEFSQQDSICRININVRAPVTVNPDYSQFIRVSQIGCYYDTTTVKVSTSRPTTTHQYTSTALPTTLTTTENNTIDLTSQLTPKQPAVTSSQGNKNAAIIGGVVGGVGGAIVVIVIVVVIAIHFRRRRKPNADHVQANGDVSKKSPKYSPIKLSELESQNFFDKLNEPQGFKDEFEHLPDQSVAECVAGCHEDNLYKNRFKNILPFEKTRVILPNHEDMQNCDYINANHIRSFDGAQKSYIAAQGPTAKTVADFLQMIWSENVNRIVMLCLVIEDTKKRCEPYWNESGQSKDIYRYFTVELDRQDVYGDFALRVFKLRYKNETPRTVTQLNYLLWKDKNVPRNPYTLLEFLRQVHKLDKDATGPLLVHCSAGVGRTGSFIALDHLLDQAKQQKAVCVFDVVKKLREQRMSMVQTLTQYQFLYKTICEFNNNGTTVIPRKNLEHQFKDLNRSQPNGSVIEQQFNALKHYKESKVVSGTKEGLLPLNRLKNRRPDIVASNSCRVYLRAGADSDYINACVMTGFKCPLSYILTQIPLAGTVSDFWQMIVKESSATIVLLDKVDDTDIVVSYWPKDVNASETYGQVNVKYLSYHTVGGIIVREFKVGDESKNTNSSGELRTVRMYEYTSWNDEHQVPQSTQEFLDLISMVKDWQNSLVPWENNEQKLSVTVQCLDGATRSGLYAAASYVIDKMNSDQEVDVFLSCRYVVSVQPFTIISIEQYKFLYDLAFKNLTWKSTKGLESLENNSAPIYINSDLSDETTYVNLPNTTNIPTTTQEGVYANAEE